MSTWKPVIVAMEAFMEKEIGLLSKPKTYGANILDSLWRAVMNSADQKLEQVLHEVFHRA